MESQSPFSGHVYVGSSSQGCFFSIALHSTTSSPTLGAWAPLHAIRLLPSLLVASVSCLPWLKHFIQETHLAPTVEVRENSTEGFPILLPQKGGFAV